jgi:hypothetical protein
MTVTGLEIPKCIFLVKQADQVHLQVIFINLLVNFFAIFHGFLK